MTDERVEEVLKDLLELMTDSEEWERAGAINEALKAFRNRPKWIKIEEREMTEEEKEYFSRCSESGMILECELPEEGEEVLVSNGEYIEINTYENDPEYGASFDDYEIHSGMYWMKLPDLPNQRRC